MAKKKDKKTWPLLIGAIGFGVAAALLSVLYLKSREAAILASLKGPEVRNVSVVVAKQDLPKGSIISLDGFAVRKVPENYVHSDVVRPGDFEHFLGRALVENLETGKTLLRSFMDEDFPVDFSDIIPAGHRALTVTVDEVNSVAGHIRPGNLIDIYVNIPFRASGFSPKAVTAGLSQTLPAGLADSLPPELLNQASGIAEEVLALAAPSDVILPVVQSVRVLAAGKDDYSETLDNLRQPQRRREGNFTSVTLKVTPRQAALLTTAQDKGELLALLRNRKDKSGADFTTVSPRDLFDNARKMARDEKLRQAAASVASGVDANGNLVNAEGKAILNKEQLAAAGLSVNANGELVDKDGNVVDPASLVIAADGTVMTREQLAAAGLSVNAQGQLVDANGKVVDSDQLVVAADGSVMTREQLAAAGLSVNANGEIVDASGNVVSADQVVIGANGSVMTKAQLAAAGLSVNENGEIVDANGNVVSADEIVVAADGTIVTKQQLAAAGLKLNDKGQVVDKDGNVVSSDALGNALGRPPTRVAGIGRPRTRVVDLIIGGASEDGVAKVSQLPVGK